MDKMTIFYSKSTGDINCYCTGEQNMSYYGKFASDMAVVFDFIVLDYDQYVMDNINNFVVNAGVLKLKQSSIPNYPTI